MRTLLIVLVLAGVSFAGVQEDTLKGDRHYPFAPYEHMFSMGHETPAVLPDGIVLGNTKYFIMIVKPDPSIDYKILKVPPGGMGRGEHVPPLRGFDRSDTLRLR